MLTGQSRYYLLTPDSCAETYWSLAYCLFVMVAADREKVCWYYYTTSQKLITCAGFLGWIWHVRKEKKAMQQRHSWCEHTVMQHRFEAYQHNKFHLISKCSESIWNRVNDFSLLNRSWSPKLNHDHLWWFKKKVFMRFSRWNNEMKITHTELDRMCQTYINFQKGENMRRTLTRAAADFRNSSASVPATATALSLTLQSEAVQLKPEGVLSHTSLFHHWIGIKMQKLTFDRVEILQNCHFKAYVFAMAGCVSQG